MATITVSAPNRVCVHGWRQSRVNAKIAIPDPGRPVAQPHLGPEMIVSKNTPARKEQVLVGE